MAERGCKSNWYPFGTSYMLRVCGGTRRTEKIERRDLALQSANLLCNYIHYIRMKLGIRIPFSLVDGNLPKRSDVLFPISIFIRPGTEGTWSIDRVTISRWIREEIAPLILRLGCDSSKLISSSTWWMQRICGLLRLLDHRETGECSWGEDKETDDSGYSWSSSSRYASYNRGSKGGNQTTVRAMQGLWMGFALSHLCYSQDIN